MLENVILCIDGTSYKYTFKGYKFYDGTINKIKGNSLCLLLALCIESKPATDWRSIGCVRFTLESLEHSLVIWDCSTVTLHSVKDDKTFSLKQTVTVFGSGTVKAQQEKISLLLELLPYTIFDFFFYQ